MGKSALQHKTSSSRRGLLVHLVQERLETDRFAYIAIARPKPKAASASLSALLLTDAEAA